MGWTIIGSCEGDPIWRYPVNGNRNMVLLLLRGIGGCSYGEIWEVFMIGPNALNASLESLRSSDSFVKLYDKTHSLTEERFVSYNEETGTEGLETINILFPVKIRELKDKLSKKLEHFREYY